MTPLLKQKTKRPTKKNKAKHKKQRKSNSWLRGHNKIVKARKEGIFIIPRNRAEKRICNSQSNDSFSFLFLSSLCVFDSIINCFLITFLKRYLLSGSFADNYKSRVSMDPC